MTLVPEQEFKPEQLRAFYGFVVPVWTGEKTDDVLLSAAANLIQQGLFPNLWQQNRNDQAMYEAQDVDSNGNIRANCKVPGSESRTNRAYINELIESYATLYPDERDDVEKYQLEWNGRVEGDDRPEKSFNISELRSIREFGRHLIKNSRTEEFYKLVPAKVISIGDLRLISNVNKATESQSRHQAALRNGSEFKDPQDLSPISGNWKGGWSEIGGYANDLAETIKTGQKFRDAKKDRIRDLPDELEKTRKNAKHFKAENAAVQNRTFDFAVRHGDLDEYVRLSPNYRDGWVKIPRGIDPSDEAKIERRIQRLENDQLTREVADLTRKSNREIAELRELFFRSRDLIDRLAGESGPERSWGLRWMDAWQYLTEGFELIDRIAIPSSREQYREEAVTAIHRATEGVALSELGFPGKKNLTIITAIFFGIAFGAVVIWNTQFNNDPLHGHAAAIAAIAALVFHYGFLRPAVSRYSYRPVYILLAVVAISLVLVVGIGNIQRDGITQKYEQHFQNLRNALK